MSRLLIVLPVRAVRAQEHIEIEAQAHNGLRLWLKHFEYVTLVCLLTSSQQEKTLPLSTIEGGERLRFIGLPEAWLPHRFAAYLPMVVRTLSKEIDRADYLQFAIGGLWGDWPSVGAIIAAAKRRAFAVWTDRVESNVQFVRGTTKRGAARLYHLATAEMMRRYEKAIIRRADLGLFHGADCFATYAGFCENPHLVHNIHIGPDQHISMEHLRSRVRQRRGPLRIAYAGRASLEKGILDWVEAISKASINGTGIAATWFGGGPELETARRLASDLSAPVNFPGPVPHEALMDVLKEFDLFVFCHKTLESPRCLIEALACGLPIIGYRSPYPEDLLREHLGGILVEPNSPSELANAISRMSSADELARLSFAAKEASADFTDEAVFLHRSELIMTLLSRS